jgi:hypothetical protein
MPLRARPSLELVDCAACAALQVLERISEGSFHFADGSFGAALVLQPAVAKSAPCHLLERTRHLTPATHDLIPVQHTAHSFLSHADRHRAGLFLRMMKQPGRTACRLVPNLL